MLKTILYLLLAALVLVQFVRPNNNISKGDQPNHIAKKYELPANVEGILRKSCYDCHSNNTVYPWYANVQPAGMWMNSHIREGKGEMNFDEFLTYSPKKARHKLEECIEKVKEGEMPLNSYTWIHKDANLTQDEKVAITSWAQSTMEKIQ
jgi:hypothetical protein